MECYCHLRHVQDLLANKEGPSGPHQGGGGFNPSSLPLPNRLTPLSPPPSLPPSLPPSPPLSVLSPAFCPPLPRSSSLNLPPPPFSRSLSSPTPPFQPFHFHFQFLPSPPPGDRGGGMSPGVGGREGGERRDRGRGGGGEPLDFLMATQADAQSALRLMRSCKDA